MNLRTSHREERMGTQPSASWSSRGVCLLVEHAAHEMHVTEDGHVLALQDAEAYRACLQAAMDLIHSLQRENKQMQERYYALLDRVRAERRR